VTGWQGNEGNQGWQQQPDPYGPDPYAYDPADPYGYGQDPYAQYPPQYSTGSFAAQAPPPPPPKRSKLPMILSLVAIVIIVGAVVAIVLWNRSKNEETAAPGEETTKTSPSERPPSERNTTSAEDWMFVDNKAEAGLTYGVPADWTLSNETKPSGEEGIEFSGVAEYGIYSCEGDDYVRSFVASGDVQGRGGTDADPTETVKHFATKVAGEYFGDDATVEVSEPTEQPVDDKTAMTVTAKVTPKVTKPDCQPATAEVTIVGVPVEKEGQANGVTMLVVVTAVEGGPADPTPTTSEQTEMILVSVSAG
jgi:cytoskeletal protein RodZ